MAGDLNTLPRRQVRVGLLAKRCRPRFQFVQLIAEFEMLLVREYAEILDLLLQLDNRLLELQPAGFHSRSFRYGRPIRTKSAARRASFPARSVA